MQNHEICKGSLKGWPHDATSHTIFCVNGKLQLVASTNHAALRASEDAIAPSIACNVASCSQPFLQKVNRE